MKGGADKKQREAVGQKPGMGFGSWYGWTDQMSTN